MPMTRRVSGNRGAGLPMKRTPTLRTIAKGTGAVLLGLVALDLAATAITLVLGAEWLRR
jgi:hypothetical protein